MSTNIVEDGRDLARDFGQQVTFNYEQASMYQNLVEEEFEELQEAISGFHVNYLGENDASPDALAEVIDGIVDLMVVSLGLGLSLGVDMQAAWDEVLASNRSKIGADGVVHYREDGKVLKPPHYRRPDLIQIAKNALGAE